MDSVWGMRYNFFRLVLAKSLFVAAILIVLPANAQVAGKRLSDWLLEQPRDSQTYALGLSWRVPGEVPSQLTLRGGLLSSLSGTNTEVSANADARNALRSWLVSLPVTGRVRVPVPDARWLQANPSRDPILGENQTVILPSRPRSVTVVTSSGDRCDVIHLPLAEAHTYIDECDRESGSRVDWAWIAQPDGRVQRFGIGIWNEEFQDSPAPGAWIWAPVRDSGWSDGFSERLVTFLATQGPSMGGAWNYSIVSNTIGTRHGRLDEVVSTPTTFSKSGAHADADGRQLINARGVDLNRSTEKSLGSLSQGKSNSFKAISGDWGGVGLLQTPTSRMASVGNISSTLNRVYPYTNYNFLVTPLGWLEAGFRYTNISNVAYSDGNPQAYKDKGFDAKFRLHEESAYTPELALGFRDIAGTGLFSSEFLVANKRTSSFDWSLGLGWGYLGSRGNIANPLVRLSSKFESRANGFGQGGSLSSLAYFRGPASIFGGVQYQTPWDSVLLKLEYDGHNYKSEPLGGGQFQRYPWNFGVVYRPYRALDVTLGVERGTTAMLTLTWHGNFFELGMPKLFDSPPVPVSAARPQLSPDWSKTARDISAQTEWQVQKIERDAREVRVTIEDPTAIFWKDRVERVTAVLHRDAPATVDRFVLTYRDHGLDLAEHVVDRDAWVARKASALPPSERRESLIEQAPVQGNNRESKGTVEYKGTPARFENGLGLAYQQTLGGPDAFVLFQAGVEEWARFRIRDDTWMQGYLRVGLVNNYEKFTVTGPSELPRVRTYLREFVTTSRVTMPSLYLANVGKIAQNHYFSAYGGYLEPMFAGFGGEWLYRPSQSGLAFGIDANVVQQRAFKQDFALRDYRTTTGHATLYWDTGWNGVQMNLSAGRYLAKDIGATFDFSRTFSNGTRVGAFFTRTNVSPQQFGEGSYDKGVYVSIPFDTFMPKTSNAVANVLWRPLTRDGGAKLDRPVRLYDTTSLIDPRTLQRESAPPLNETLPAGDQRDSWKRTMTGPEPYTRVIPVPFTAQLQSIDPDRYKHELVEALYAQQFRDISVSYDVSHRLTIQAVSGIRPLSRAAGRVARTALRMAPIDAREIRVVFNVNGSPSVRYDFIDLQLLGQFFDGHVGLSSVAGTVAVEYFNASEREDEPVALLGDMSTQAASPKQLTDVILPSKGTRDRVMEDFIGAGREFASVNWFQSSLLGAGLILASSIADKRADKFSADHQSSAWLGKINSVGNALPWVAIGGALVAAAGASDLALSRTGFAATESGITALGVVTGLKYVFGRARPESGLGPKEFKPFSSTAGFDSFPSGHTIISWAVITPFAEEYNAPWLYGVAAVTNLARVGSRQHWLSDTVAGSALGYGIGKVFWEAGRDASRKGPRVVVGPRSLSLSWATD